MLRLSAAGLRAHPLRYVLTGIVVVLSVGFTAGTLVLTDSLNRAAEMEGAASAEALRIPLLTLGAVSLIVATFVIANTFRILVAQRTRELALLRTVGATRRQVLMGVLAEAGVVGLLGGLAGLFLGVAAGAGVGHLIADGASDLPLVVSTATLVWPPALGLVVTVGSALPPARAATRVPPVAAAWAVPEADDSEPVRRRRTGAGLVLTLVGGSMLLGGAAVETGYLGLIAVVAGSTVSFLGILLLSVRIVPRAIRALAALAGRLSDSARPAIELAAANAVRNPRRAAATSAGLLIGVTVVTGFVTVGESTRASIDVVLDQQVPADFVVTTRSGDGVPAEAVEAIEALPETGASVSLYRARVGSEDLGSVDLLGLSLADYDGIARVTGDGSVGDIAGGAAAITELLAREHDLGVGDSVAVAGRTLRIGYVVDESAAPLPGVVVSPETFGDVAQDVAGPEQFAVDAAAGTPDDDARTAVEDAVAAMPDISVYSNLVAKEQINRELERAVAVVVAILGLAVVIAGIGMANTLSLAVHERTREIGLLRALGITARGTQVMLGIEALLTSFVAAAMGVAVGLAYSWAAVSSVPNLVFKVPWWQLMLFLVVATLLGLLASGLPARRAARIAPVAALAQT